MPIVGAMSTYAGHLDEHPPVLGVAGLPHVAAASLSPAMFAAAFEALGMRAWYVPLAVRERSARKALRSLPRLGFHGANVTMPYKLLAADVAHTRSETVEQTGVANTLLIDADGQIHAEATDGIAVVEAVEEAGHQLDGASITLYGAGGVGIDIAFACARAGAASITVWNRTRERADELVARLRNSFPALELTVSADLPIHVPAHVLVSAVPASAVPSELAAVLHPGVVVVDLAYRPDRRPTALIEAARRSGAPCVDGRELLVRQAAHGFRMWFGIEPPTEVMARAVT